MVTSFKKWLSEAEAPLGPVGDLIGDLRSDEDLPDDIESAAQLRGYLKRVGACSGAMQAIPQVWKRYQRAAS
jgi:YozE SAM-like fold